MTRIMILLAMLLASLLLSPATLAEEAVQQLEMAFGLFSVELPAEAEVGPNTGNALADLRYEVSTFSYPVYANFAPISEYEATAQRKLNSHVSLLFVLCGPDGYSETEVTEETLPNGVTLRWQLMRGSAGHALWFEAFTEQFGYNMMLFGEPTDVQDQAMLAVMRSFRADAEHETDLLQLRQTKQADGSFISVEHGLQIQLDEGWNPVTIEDLLLPQTAFMLEKDGGRWLIQLMYAYPLEMDAKSLLDWYVNVRKTSMGEAGATFGEPYAVTLEQLGVEAWVVEEEANICLRNIAFIHEGYGYYGSFMWIKPDDADARPYMDAAIHSLTLPE